ncbi:hypothetical protein pipiens_014411, partial [Culex pipiens pipiens]
MSQSDIEFLKSQLSSARNEIKNLRQQISNLQHVYQKDVQNIRFSLENFQCKSCRSSSDAECPVYATERTENDQQTSGISFDPIGTIKTVFSDKRAVPRQASVASELLSRIELNQTIFNNPEHSLEGLDSFSHIWILYHFHRNPAHFKTKVDGTPVLDIKPYIPQYDIPAKIDQQQFFSSREAPDGEEELAEAGPSTSSKTPSNVTVPNWIANGSTLNVLFNENASNQIEQLGIEQRSIVDILKADPRSVYLRT